MIKNKNAIYDARALGMPKMMILGLQHTFAMFGATILVPMLVMTYFEDATGSAPTAGLTVPVTLFCAGMGTLIFHICSKMKVPAFLGSSFAFLGGFYTIANMTTGKYAYMSANDKIAYACGGMFVAGLLYFVLAFIIHLVGIKKVMRFLPPVVTGPIIICIGLSLSSSAISNSSTCWPLAIVAFSTTVYFIIWGKGLPRVVPILIGIIVAYVFALIMNATGYLLSDGSSLINLKNITDEAIIGIPNFQLCKFDLTTILVMAPISIASMMEHIGDMFAISAITSKSFVTDPGLDLTLFGDGLATVFSALIGGPANTTYGENSAILELSNVYDPRVVRLGAYFAIILSFVPKFSGIIMTMPTAIIGGISFILYGLISAVGVRNIVENQVDLTKSRNLIIMAVILVCGLGFTNECTFKLGGLTITLTALSVASIAGILLNAILPGNDYEFGTDKESNVHQGLHFSMVKKNEKE